MDTNTKLLLHFDGDASYSKKAISIYGTPMLDGSTKKFGNSSIKFNGTADYIAVADSEDWSFGTGDFTIDFWVNFKEYSSSKTLLAQYYDSENYWYIHHSIGSTLLFLHKDSNSIKYRYTYAFDPTPNQWYHIAFERLSTVGKLFIDGDEKTLDYTVQFGTNSLNDINATLKIGSLEGVSELFEGHLDELRITKGLARWTSNFTLPTAPYEIDIYTKLLMHFEGDSSSSGHNTQLYNNLQLTTGVSKFGSSMYFDGTNDYLTSIDSDDWDFGAGDFTIDFWMYPTQQVDNCSILQHSQYVSSTLLKWGWLCYYHSGNLMFFWSYTGGAWNAASITSISLNTWTHIAVVRYGNNILMFSNGELVTVASISSAIHDPGEPLIIGRRDLATFFKGYLDEFRISKGIARWTSNFALYDLPYSTSNEGISGNINKDSKLVVYNNTTNKLVTSSNISAGNFELATPGAAVVNVVAMNEAYGSSLVKSGISTISL